MGLFEKSWLKSAGDDELRSKRTEIEKGTDWRAGSIFDGDFDNESDSEITPIYYDDEFHY